MGFFGGSRLFGGGAATHLIMAVEINIFFRFRIVWASGSVGVDAIGDVGDDLFGAEHAVGVEAGVAKGTDEQGKVGREGAVSRRERLTHRRQRYWGGGLGRGGG